MKNVRLKDTTGQQFGGEMWHHSTYGNGLAGGNVDGLYLSYCYGVADAKGGLRVVHMSFGEGSGYGDVGGKCRGHNKDEY